MARRTSQTSASGAAAAARGAQHAGLLARITIFARTNSASLGWRFAFHATTRARLQPAAAIFTLASRTTPLIAQATRCRHWAGFLVGHSNLSLASPAGVSLHASAVLPFIYITVWRMVAALFLRRVRHRAHRVRHRQRKCLHLGPVAYIRRLSLARCIRSRICAYLAARVLAAIGRVSAHDISMGGTRYGGFCTVAQRQRCSACSGASRFVVASLTRVFFIFLRAGWHRYLVFVFVVPYWQAFTA